MKKIKLNIIHSLLMEQDMYGVSRYNNIDGVTCYMNSILAVLQQTPIFIDYILNAEFKDKLLTQNDIKSSILFQFHNLMTISHTHDNLIINPQTFRNVITLKNSMWGLRQHQDSQEFLTFLLNSIEEEIAQEVVFIPGKIKLNYTNDTNNNLIKILATSMWQKFIKKEFSIIKNLFGGMTHVVINCGYCNNKVHNFDIFQVLQLSINSNNLYDCLDSFINPESFDNHNMYTCEFCGRKTKASKNTTIWSPPPILIIQLKRFKFNNSYIPYKITDLIEYPHELNINKYIDPINNNNNNYYKLFAINNHHGNNTYAGHYTSIVKSRLDNKWYEFDDSSVLEQIDEKDLINKNAYMLFYSKI